MAPGGDSRCLGQVWRMLLQAAHAHLRGGVNGKAFWLDGQLQGEGWAWVRACTPPPSRWGWRMPWAPGLHHEGWWPDAQEVPAPAILGMQRRGRAVLGDIVAWREVRAWRRVAVAPLGSRLCAWRVWPDSPGWWWFVKWHTLKSRVCFSSGRPGGEGPWSVCSSLPVTEQVSTCGRHPALGRPAELCSRKRQGPWSRRHAESWCSQGWAPTSRTA